MSGSSADGPPQTNPILGYYQEWADRTPYVTRSSLVLLFCIFFVSLFVNLDMYLGNVPYFTVYKFEIYRLFISPWVGNSLLMLLFACMFYPQMGGRMEAAYGSTYFLYLIFLFGILINVTFTVICFVCAMVGSPEMMFLSCSGFWTILFAFVTIECMQSPGMPRRMMCIPVDIPSMYYPWVLYLLFCLFSGFQIPFALGILTGYLFHWGRLDKLRPSANYLDQLEVNGGMLHSVSRSQGWILSGSSLGHDAWLPVNTVDRDERPSSHPSSSSSSSTGSRFSGLGNVNTLGSTNSAQTNTGNTRPEEKKETTHFPGSGHTLGGGGGSSSVSRETLQKQRLAALGVTNV